MRLRFLKSSKSMAYKVIFGDARLARRDLDAIHPAERATILHKIQEFASSGPYHPQSKRLRHYALAEFRLRVGSYRILYDFSSPTQTIVVLRILHRSKLY